MTAAEKQDHLKKTHTKVLKQYLDGARKCGGWWSPCGDGSSSFGFTFDEIKAELDTRPHIPNKKESKELRQAKAKAKK